MKYVIKKGRATVKFKDLERKDYYIYPEKDVPWLYCKITHCSSFRVDDCVVLDTSSNDEVIKLEQIQPAIFNEV